MLPARCFTAFGQEGAVPGWGQPDEYLPPLTARGRDLSVRRKAFKMRGILVRAVTHFKAPGLIRAAIDMYRMKGLSPLAAQRHPVAGPGFGDPQAVMHQLAGRQVRHQHHPENPGVIQPQVSLLEGHTAGGIFVGEIDPIQVIRIIKVDFHQLD